MSVMAEVMTSFPGGSWRDPRAICTAAVPEEQPLQCFIPYMDRIATSTQETASLTYVSDREVLARDRFSSSIIGGQKIDPFEQLNIQMTSAGLTIAARRDDDNIAAP